MVVKFNKFGKKRTKFGKFNEFYNGAAEIGKGMAYMRASFILLFAILLIGGSIYFFRKKEIYTQKTTLTIVSVENLTKTLVKGTEVISCVLKGNVPGCKEIITISGYNKIVNPGETIQLWTKPNCENLDAIINRTNFKTVGWIMLGTAVFLILISIINIYFVRKHKGIAAAEGIGGVSSMIGSGFNGNGDYGS